MELPSNWKDIRVPIYWSAAAVVGILGGYGWLVTTFVSHKAFAQLAEKVIVVQATAQMALTQQIDDLTQKINLLEAKEKKTADDRHLLDYYRKQLETKKKTLGGVKQ